MEHIVRYALGLAVAFVFIMIIKGIEVIGNQTGWIVSTILTLLVIFLFFGRKNKNR